MSFGFGVGDVITVVETCFKVWRSIGTVRAFPDEIVELYAALTMEYTRFVNWTEIHGIWANARQQSSIDVSTTGKQQAADELIPKGPSGVEVRFLNQQEKNWNAVAAILRVLEHVEELTKKYRTAEPAAVDESPSISTGLAKSMEGMGLRSGTTLRKMQVRHAAQVTLLMRRSFAKKTVWAAAPWKVTDKEVLKEQVWWFRYWNEKLYEDQVSQAIWQSINSQAVPGAMLDETISVDPLYVQVLHQASRERDKPVAECGKLFVERKRTEGSGEYGELAENPEALQIPIDGITFERELSVGPSLDIGTLSGESKGPRRIITEWYPFGQSNVEEKSRARKRVANLAYTCRLKDKPSGIRILNCAGFVEDSDTRQAIGLSFEIPAWAHPSRAPRTLRSLLPPAGTDVVYLSLGQRFQLAAQLATFLHSFGIVRWFHKNFNSHKVLFFPNKSDVQYDFKSPWIVGFDISRQDNTQSEIVSMNKSLEELSIYLHPDLRVPDHKDRPKYTRRYDMYSLGLMLVEVGFWSRLDALMKSRMSSTPERFTEAVIAKCEAQLGHFMGTRYKDVAVSCLRGDDMTESVDEFYWIVVMELLKCPVDCQKGTDA